MKCAAFIGDAGTNMRHEKAPAICAEYRLARDTRQPPPSTLAAQKL